MTFSKRYNFENTEPPITIRTDAPDGLRYAVVNNAYDCGPNYTEIRSVICRVLFIAPDIGNWSEVPNIRDEALTEIRNCEWYKVYNIAEALIVFIEDNYGYDSAVSYAKAMNEHFIGAGIGWQFSPNEGIVYRGEETFGIATKAASSILADSGRKNAAVEIHEAICDISRRPAPDITGAISHAMAAVECVAQDVIGTSETLGKFIGKLALPKPLDQALEKLWGFASQNGRHVSEASDPTSDDAELVVHIACAICIYLTKKSRGISTRFY